MAKRRDMLERLAAIREANKDTMATMDATLQAVRQMSVTLRGCRVITDDKEEVVGVTQTLEVVLRCGAIEPLCLAVDLPPHEAGLAAELAAVHQALGTAFDLVPGLQERAREAQAEMMRAPKFRSQVAKSGEGSSPVPVVEGRAAKSAGASGSKTTSDTKGDE